MLSPPIRLKTDRIDQESRWLAMATTFALQISLFVVMASLNMTIPESEKDDPEPNILFVMPAPLPTASVPEETVKRFPPVPQSKPEKTTDLLPDHNIQEPIRNHTMTPLIPRTIPHPLESNPLPKPESTVTAPSESVVLSDAHVQKDERQRSQEMSPAHSSKIDLPVTSKETQPPSLPPKTERYVSNDRRFTQEALPTPIQEIPVSSYQAFPDKSAIIEAFLNKIEPLKHYPYMARRRGIEGTVLISVFLDRTGELKEVGLKMSSGYEILDKSAIELIKRACPFRHGCESDLKMEIPITYKLMR